MRAFLAYCAEVKDQYVKFHEPLEKVFDKHHFSYWTGHEIKLGQEIDEDIKINMELAEYHLLFISPDFIASNLFDHKKFKAVLKQHYNLKAKIIPIIVKPCNLKAIREFIKFRALPRANKPISAYENLEQAISDVIEGIDTAITEYRKQGVRFLDFSVNEREERTLNLINYIGHMVRGEGNEPLDELSPPGTFGALTIEEYFQFLDEHKKRGLITYSVAHPFTVRGARDVNLTPKGWAMFRAYLYTDDSRRF